MFKRQNHIIYLNAQCLTLYWYFANSCYDELDFKHGKWWYFNKFTSSVFLQFQNNAMVILITCFHYFNYWVINTRGLLSCGRLQSHRKGAKAWRTAHHYQQCHFAFTNPDQNQPQEGVVAFSNGTFFNTHYLILNIK